jgi:hypothetical protein
VSAPFQSDDTISVSGSSGPHSPHQYLTAAEYWVSSGTRPLHQYLTAAEHRVVQKHHWLGNRV